MIPGQTEIRPAAQPEEADNIPVSIILPSFNYARHLPAALESIIAQSHTDWELLLVEDGSTDDSLAIARSYAGRDKRINVLTHPEHQNWGLAEAIKLGLVTAKHEWVAFLEADDTWQARSLELRLQLALLPQTALVFSDARLVLEEGRNPEYYFYIRSILEQVAARRDPPQVKAHELAAINLVPTFSCAMARRSLLLNCDFKPPIVPLLDKWLWQQMAALGACRYLHAPLTNWRLHAGSYISSAFDEQDLAQTRLWQTRSRALPGLSQAKDWRLRWVVRHPAICGMAVRIWLKLRSQGLAGVVKAIQKRFSSRFDRIAG